MAKGLAQVRLTWVETDQIHKPKFSQRMAHLFIDLYTHSYLKYYIIDVLQIPFDILPNNKFLDKTKLKAFADDKSNLTKKKFLSLIQ